MSPRVSKEHFDGISSSNGGPIIVSITDAPYTPHPSTAPSGRVRDWSLVVSLPIAVCYITLLHPAIPDSRHLPTPESNNDHIPRQRKPRLCHPPEKAKRCSPSTREVCPNFSQILRLRMLSRNDQLISPARLEKNRRRRRTCKNSPGPPRSFTYTAIRRDCCHPVCSFHKESAPRSRPPLTLSSLILYP